MKSDREWANERNESQWHIYREKEREANWMNYNTLKSTVWLPFYDDVGPKVSLRKRMEYVVCICVAGVGYYSKCSYTQHIIIFSKMSTKLFLLFLIFAKEGRRSHNNHAMHKTFDVLALEYMCVYQCMFDV